MPADIEKVSLAKAVLKHYCQQVPVIGILRGVSPDKVLAVADVIVSSGIRAIEVPTNSPDCFLSIKLLVEFFGEDVLIGAGTVTSLKQVDALQKAGGKLLVSPNVDTDVISKASQLGMVVLPGFVTPTEAFKALNAGATGLKLFPASSVQINHISALNAVLPPDTDIYAVGGVGASNYKLWSAAGAAGMGVGSELYKPDYSLGEIKKRAEALVASVKNQ